MTQVSAKADETQSRAGAAAPTSAPVAQTGSSVAPLDRRFWTGAWWWAGAAILLVATVLRLYDLSAKVMHHDEGVNGVFTSTLFHQGGYKYDPTNFHGPSLYYAALLTTSINSFFYGRDGLSLFAIRLVPAIFGIGLVWLMLCLRRPLTTFGAIAAALLATISPGMVFFSRYFIHELMFVFFSLAILVAWLKYQETKKPRYFILASASAALLCATKETWIITVAVWLLAIPCTVIYLRLLGNPHEEDATKNKRNVRKRLPSSGGAEPEAVWSKRKLYFTAAAGLYRGVRAAVFLVLHEPQRRG